jgi:5-methylcytosine-specific restriction endonuclease McrA
MEPALQEAIRGRAGYRCEYCRFPERFAELPFHLDHVISQQHGGPTSPDNLAFACCHCNRYKGPNLSGIDPQTNQVVELFHPRK